MTMQATSRLIGCCSESEGRLLMDTERASGIHPPLYSATEKMKPICCHLNLLCQAFKPEDQFLLQTQIW